MAHALVAGFQALATSAADERRALESLAPVLREFGRGGETVREAALRYRKEKFNGDAPAIESIKVFRRTVAQTPWEEMEVPS